MKGESRGGGGGNWGVRIRVKSQESIVESSVISIRDKHKAALKPSPVMCTSSYIYSAVKMGIVF